MRFTLHVDGTIEGDLPPIRLTHFNMQGNVATPKYTCPYREGKCKMSPCGKRPVFRWYCNHFRKDVNLLDCEGCNVRK